MARRVLTLLAALGLASAMAVLPSVPTSATPVDTASHAQTVAFTTTPPTGADWFSDNWSIEIGYVASASASSGLPVTFSLDPASAGVCAIVDGFGAEDQAAIRFVGPGTCTILADQAGDDVYLPAPQASQSFVIEKAQPTLSGVKGRKLVPGLPSATFRATLQVLYNLSSHDWGHRGYEGQVIAFTVAGRPVCSATTDAEGVASCTGPLPLRTWLTQLRFTASYAGDARYKSVFGSAAFVG